MKYWAYQHVDGGIHVKAYREDAAHARASIEDAYDSPFVEDVLEPYEAASRAVAEQTAKAKFEQETAQ